MIISVGVLWQQIQTSEGKDVVFIEVKDMVLWQMVAKFWLQVVSLGKQSDSPVIEMPRTHCLHSPTSGRNWLSWVDSEIFPSISLKWSCLRETHRTNSYQLLSPLPFEMEVGHVWICGGNIAGLYHNHEFIRISNGKIQTPVLSRYVLT